MNHPSYPPPKGRGAAINPDNRFSDWAREAIDDGWDNTEEEPTPLATELIVDTAKTVISRNDSADIPFSQSINPSNTAVEPVLGKIPARAHWCCLALPMQHAYQSSYLNRTHPGNRQVSSKGQIVIPKSLRESHHIHTDNSFIVTAVGDELRLKHAPAAGQSSLKSVAGMLHRPAVKKLSDKQLEPSVAARLRHEDKSSKSR